MDKIKFKDLIDNPTCRCNINQIIKDYSGKGNNAEIGYQKKKLYLHEKLKPQEQEIMKTIEKYFGRGYCEIVWVKNLEASKCE